MSELAAAYYQSRAEDLGLGEVPELLKGDPVCLLIAGERPTPHVIAERFAEAVRSVERFVLDGVHGVYEAEGSPLTMPEWRRIRKLPPLPNRSHDVEEYATAQSVPALLSVFPLRGGEVFLEAYARSEISERMLRRASLSAYGARLPAQESAQAYLMARTTTNRGRTCTAAHFTVVWGDHSPATGMALTRRRPEALTLRYLGAQLLNRETATLPPLAS